MVPAGGSAGLRARAGGGGNCAPLARAHHEAGREDFRRVRGRTGG